ncbi:MAG: DUF3179 domain-containing protein [Dehalococcoidia bacterium]|nr:DUF3179 domain-containing protein [Dehalococcoidia bacterium]
MPSNLLYIHLILVVGLSAVALGCFGGSSVPPTPEPTPAQVSARADMSAKTTIAAPTSTPTPTSTPVPEATRAPDATPTSVDKEATPSPVPTAVPYESEAAMYDMFPGFTMSMQQTLEALERIKQNDDSSMIPVLIEVMRFMPTRSSRDSVADTLRALTGQPYEGNDWDKWMDWMGANLDDIEPPEGYPDWKARLYSAIDERFAFFLRPARDTSRIRLEEVVWGGVRPDGIPDLRRPSFLEASEADYMDPDDRVFGLEINGDVRAYPLRVVNAHEMVNDSVGGEPISLMW